MTSHYLCQFCWFLEVLCLKMFIDGLIFFIIAYSKLGLEVLLLHTFEITNYDFIKIKFDYLWTAVFCCAHE